jgi:hypothetical protein
MRDTQYEINVTFNNLIKDLFMVSELDDEVADVDINKVNVHVIN